MSAPNHYEALGLPPSASQADIEKRYQELARLYQIDAAAPASVEGMAGLIVEAYRVLSNAALRAHYDAGVERATTDDRRPTTVNPAPPTVAPGRPALNTQHSPADSDRTQEIPPAAGPTSI